MVAPKMKRVTGIVIAAAALLMAANVAHADVTMNSVRVSGTDTVALTKFYQFQRAAASSRYTERSRR